MSDTLKPQCATKECGKLADLRCQRCRTPYCSVLCQKADWTSGQHRILCAAHVNGRSIEKETESSVKKAPRVSGGSNADGSRSGGEALFDYVTDAARLGWPERGCNHQIVVAWMKNDVLFRQESHTHVDMMKKLPYQQFTWVGIYYFYDRARSLTDACTFCYRMLALPFVCAFFFFFFFCLRVFLFRSPILSLSVSFFFFSLFHKWTLKVWPRVFGELKALLGSREAVMLIVTSCYFSEILDWYRGFPYEMLGDCSGFAGTVFARGAAMHALFAHEVSRLRGWSLRNPPSQSASLLKVAASCGIENAGVSSSPMRHVGKLKKPIENKQASLVSGEQQQPDVVFVLGLPRSGTTLLQCLLAADPASRAPRNWEWQFPTMHFPAAERVSMSIEEYAPTVESDRNGPRRGANHPMHPAEDAALLQHFGMVGGWASAVFSEDAKDHSKTTVNDHSASPHFFSV